MNLIEKIKQKGQLLGSHPGEKTYKLQLHDRTWLIKAFAIPQRFTAEYTAVRPKFVKTANLPISFNVVRWKKLRILEQDHRAALNLPENDWLLACRPFVSGSDLRQINFVDHDWRQLALAIALALRDLHEAGTIHGDIQPGNIVVNEDNQIKFIDIPILPKAADEPGYIAGSAPYMAPERWEHEEATPFSDIYAFARLICWMARGKTNEIKEGDLSEWAVFHTSQRWSIPETVDGKLEGIVCRTLEESPKNRPSIQTFIDHLQTSEHKKSPGRISPFSAKLEHESQAGFEALAIEQTPILWLQPFLANSNSYLCNGLLYKLKRKLELANYEILQPNSKTSGSSPFSKSRPSKDKRLRIDLRPNPDDFEIALEADSQRQWEQYILNKAVKSQHPDTGCDFGFVPNNADWNRWRNHTLRVDIRDIPSGRWNELLEQYSDRPQQLIDVLNQHPTDGSTTDSVAKFDTYLDDLEQLQKKSQYQSILEKAQSADPKLEFSKNTPERKARYLDILLDAMLFGGYSTDQFKQLTDVVSAHLQSYQIDRKLGEKLFQLLHARKFHDRGLQLLETLESPEPTSLNLWLKSWRAQFLLSSSKFGEAQKIAQQGLNQLDSLEGSHTRLTLVFNLVKTAVKAIRADDDAIQNLADIAHEMSQTDLFPSTIARCHAYRAMGLSRLDKHEEATEAHQRALQICEESGLILELPTYLLNTGTAYHRQGQLGLAREYYARGVRVANPLVRPSTRGLLTANQANIDRCLGRLDEAESLVQKARQLAESEQLRHVLILCASIQGDLYADRQNDQKALESYRIPLDSDSLHPSSFDTAEAHLHVCETLLNLEAYTEARRHLNEARSSIRKNDLNDLRHYAQTLRARLEWNTHGQMGLMSGIEKYRRALLDASSSGNYLFVIEQSPYLWERLKEQNLQKLQREIADLVEDAKNAIATGLTKELRDDFYEHTPSISVQNSTEEPELPAPHESERNSKQANQKLIDKFYRMLSLNEIILQCDQLESLWPKALDVGLTLSGAQRGFILLYRQNDSNAPYKIVASQDVQGNQIPDPHLEVSLTIAEESAETGQTVVTVNATDDDRFNTALSVVDLELTSVLCVPIQNSEGLLGALYLDHQFQSGLFNDNIRRLMEAYGHQLAVEISAIRRRNQLERKEQKLQTLLDERETKLEAVKQRAEQLTRQIEKQRTRETTASEFPDIAYTSEPMEQLMNRVLRISTSDISVVIQGESGVGKELIARAIHKKSARAENGFVTLNCGAVSESLFESEMFGHTKGAFTGADRDKEGIFRSASGGTLFLDEVGEIPPPMQVKLLRALQEQQVRPVGSSETKEIDIRVIAATNRALESMVEAGTFREDLYYRLATLVLDVPPLRERPEDIPIIANYLVEQINQKQNTNVSITPDSARFLTDLKWPGNIRELKNTLRAAAALTTDETIDRATIEPLVDQASKSHSTDQKVTTNPKSETDQSSGRVGRRRKASRREVEKALKKTEGNRKEAAQLLGVSRRTIYRYIDNYGLA